MSLGTPIDIRLAQKYGLPESNEPLPLFRCQACGELVTKRLECELPDCRKKVCETCIIHNILETGWDVCLDCSDSREVLEEARELKKRRPKNEL